MEIRKYEAGELLQDKTFRLNEGLNEITLADLLDSIKKEGQLFPVIVRETNQRTLQLLDGWHRVTACERLNLKVEAKIVQVTDKEAWGIAVAAQVCRRNITGYEKYLAFMKLIDQGFSVSEADKKCGRSPDSKRGYAIKQIKTYPAVEDTLKAGDINLERAANYAKALHAFKADNDYSVRLIGELRKRKNVSYDAIKRELENLKYRKKNEKAKMKRDEERQNKRYLISFNNESSRGKLEKELAKANEAASEIQNLLRKIPHPSFLKVSYLPKVARDERN